LQFIVLINILVLANKLALYAIICHIYSIMHNNDFSFLQGGGEMGELIRATDWSKTPIGSPESWPEPLCTSVSLMLNNLFPMYIAWGNEYTQLYNDGYRPILGTTKHPQAMGIGTRQTFAEIWHIIGPMFEGVMNGQAVGFPDFMLPLERNGYVEECYFDFPDAECETLSIGFILMGLTACATA